LQAHPEIAAAIEGGRHRDASRAIKEHLRATDESLIAAFGMTHMRRA
jgi:DNA-binding FadR family transcriptional regulator